MKIEAGKTYKVLSEANGYLVGDVFTVLSIEEKEVAVQLDHDEPYIEDLDLIEVLEMEED